MESNFKSITSTSSTQIIFANAFGSDVNTTTTIGSGLNRITVDDAGIWEVLLMGSISSYTADEILELEIKVNGTLIKTIKIKAADTNFVLSEVYALNLSAADEIKVYFDSTTDAAYDYNDIIFIAKRIN